MDAYTGKSGLEINRERSFRLREGYGLSKSCERTSVLVHYENGHSVPRIVHEEVTAMAKYGNDFAVANGDPYFKAW